MAKEKKPSIYADRGTIGSSEELDKYGVWIKSELQDLPNKKPGLSQKIPDDDLDADDLEMGIPDIGDLPDFDTLEDEIDMDLPEDSDSMDVSSVETDDDTDDFDIPDMDDINDDDDDDNEVTPVDSDEDGDSDVFDFGDFSEQDVMSDLSETGPDLSDSEDDLETSDDIEIPDDIETSEDIEIPDDINSPEDIVLPEADEDFSEISDDDFIGIDDADSTDFEKSGEPDELAIFEKPAAEKPAPSQDLSTQLLMKIAEELSSIRTELSGLKKEFSGIKAAAPKEVKGEKGYFTTEEDDEKIALTGAELINIMNTADFTQETGKDASNELSDDDLDIRISDEEITFDDDSSEDELDVVLNDAPASEETDELEISDIAEEVEELDISDISEEADELEISGIAEDISEEDFPPDLVIAEEDLEISDDNIPDFSEEDAEELKQMREEGAQPIAFAPTLEDAEYLKEDPLADSETDDDETDDDEPEVEDIYLDFEESLDNSIDLSEAVIDEPDLSLEITDNPLEEPSLDDISIDLDLSELESDELLPVDETEEIQEESLEDIEDVSEVTLEEISDEPSGELLYEESADGEADLTELEEDILLPELPEDDAYTLSEDVSSNDILSEDILSDDLLSEDLELEELASEETDSAADSSLIPENFTVEEPEIISVETFADDSLDSLPGPLDELEDELDILDSGEELPDLVEDVQDDESLTELDPLEMDEDEFDSDELDSMESDPAELHPAELQPEEPPADSDIPVKLKQELKVVLSYMDQLLESLPDDKIEEFAKSEYYDTYKKLFKELGLV